MNSLISQAAPRAHRFHNAQSELQQTGFCYLTKDEGFFAPEEWDRMADILNDPRLPYEHVLIGDAGEDNNLRVARFVTDVERPLLVNQPLSNKMLDILAAPARMAFYTDLLGGKPAHVRRAQVNALAAGSFIGHHLDTDSNPDYTYSIVLQFGKSFSGGEFRAFGSGGHVFHASPALHSVLITKSSVPHQVDVVTSGERVSLVYFLSEFGGDNRRLARA